MKALNAIYTDDDLIRIAEQMKYLAREHPGIKQNHTFLNGMRVSVEYDPASGEYKTYLGAIGQALERADLEMWQFALDATKSERVMPREFSGNGKIYYAQGFKWRVTTGASELKPT